MASMENLMWLINSVKSDKNMLRVIERVVENMPTVEKHQTLFSTWYILDNLTKDEILYIKRIIYFYMKEQEIKPPENFNLEEAIKNLKIDISINERKINKMKKINKPDKLLINKLNYIQNHESYITRLEKAVFNTLNKVELKETYKENSEEL